MYQSLTGRATRKLFIKLMLYFALFKPETGRTLQYFPIDRANQIIGSFVFLKMCRCNPFRSFLYTHLQIPLLVLDDRVVDEESRKFDWVCSLQRPQYPKLSISSNLCFVLQNHKDHQQTTQKDPWDWNWIERLVFQMKWMKLIQKFERAYRSRMYCRCRKN